MLYYVILPKILDLNIRLVRSTTKTSRRNNETFVWGTYPICMTEEISVALAMETHHGISWHDIISSWSMDITVPWRPTYCHIPKEFMLINKTNKTFYWVQIAMSISAVLDVVIIGFSLYDLQVKILVQKGERQRNNIALELFHFGYQVRNEYIWISWLTISSNGRVLNNVFGFNTFNYVFSFWILNYFDCEC